jgi:hypothetical protein
LKTKEEIKFATLMSLITTFFVTYVIVSINLGFKPNFLFIWMRTWAIAFVLVGISILYFAPILRRMIGKK